MKFVEDLNESLRRSPIFTRKKVDLRNNKHIFVLVLHGCTILYNRF